MRTCVKYLLRLGAKALHVLESQHQSSQERKQRVGNSSRRHEHPPVGPSMSPAAAPRSPVLSYRKTDTEVSLIQARQSITTKHKFLELAGRRLMVDAGEKCAASKDLELIGLCARVLSCACRSVVSSGKDK